MDRAGSEPVAGGKSEVRPLDDLTLPIVLAASSAGMSHARCDGHAVTVLDRRRIRTGVIAAVGSASPLTDVSAAGLTP